MRREPGRMGAEWTEAWNHLINPSRLEGWELGTWASRGNWVADQLPCNTHA